MAVWQTFIISPVGGFSVILLGMMFLCAEILVRGRLVLGLLGLLSLGSYFTVHLIEGYAVWMGAAFVLGLILVIVDGKWIGDGTLAGLGIILMLVSVALPAPTFFYGVAVACAFVLGIVASFIFPKFMPRRPLWSKLMLKDTLSSEKGYNSLNEAYVQLTGKQGIAETDFRPSGTILIEGKTYSAVSDGKWIKKGTPLVVNEVSGVRILVQPVEDPSA